MIALAFDFGVKNIGVAVGEHVTKTARALQALRVTKKNPNWHLIKTLLTYWEPRIIIVGLPLNIDGTKQNTTVEAEKFAHKLKYKFNILVELHDERLSTVEARSIIFHQGGFKALQKNSIDSIAAVIILESWFSQRYEKNHKNILHNNNYFIKKTQPCTL